MFCFLEIKFNSRDFLEVSFLVSLFLGSVEFYPPCWFESGGLPDRLLYSHMSQLFKIKVSQSHANFSFFPLIIV